jgi:hypothetical protein
MRKTLFVLMGVAGLYVAAAAAAQAQKATEKDLIGTWAGKYAGTSSGSYEMTINRDAEGKLSGSVSPKPDDGEPYTSPFNSVTFADGKAMMTLFDPPGNVEITVEVTLEGASLKGTYVVRAKADGSEVERGSLTGTKKAPKGA